MRFITKIALAVTFVLGLSGVASAQGLQLVCFEKNKLTQSLNRITNEQQLFAASDYAITKGGSCAWSMVPTGRFSAYWAGWHTSPHGFIFPVFELDYDSDGIRRFSVEGIFRARDWTLTNRCGRGGVTFSGQCLVPKSCDVTRRFLKFSGNFVPGIVRIPQECIAYRG